MPITFSQIGARVEDIPAMVAHRAEKPGGFPFGGFVSIGPKEMEEIRYCSPVNHRGRFNISSWKKAEQA